MFKFWLTRRGIFTTILTICLGILSSLAFVRPAIETDATNLLNTSTYAESDIDFDIPSPTKDQLEEIKLLEFVDDAFGYYFTKDDLVFNGKKIKSNFLFSDCMDSLEMTMYNKKRLIEESNEELNNPLYIDYEYHQKYNINIGDEVSYKNIKFQVGRIYQTNIYKKDSIIAPLVGEQKDFILSHVKSYSGAYLKTNDDTAADNYLRNYKPKGRLKSREDFNSDEAYEMHYNGWLSANYYNEITNFNSKLDNVTIVSGPNYIVGGVICGLLLIAINAVYLLIKRHTVYFKQLKRKESVLKYLTLSICHEGIFAAISMVVGAMIVSNGIALYVNPSLAPSIMLAMVLSALIALLINLVVNMIFYKAVVLKPNK